MTTSDDERISESAPTMDEAFAEVKKKAAEKWGVDKFDVTVSPSPSRNITTSEDLLYTAVAKRNPTWVGDHSHLLRRPARKLTNLTGSLRFVEKAKSASRRYGPRAIAPDGDTPPARSFSATVSPRNRAPLPPLSSASATTVESRPVPHIARRRTTEM